MSTSIDDLSSLYDKIMSREGANTGRWRWLLSTDDSGNWYRCVNCGDLLLDQRPNPYVSLDCNTCGCGEAALMKVDPVVEAQVRNAVIDRVTK